MKLVFVLFLIENYRLIMPQTTKDNAAVVKALLLSIQQATQQMSNSFQEGIQRHQQQFMKCFKIKIWQLVRLFNQLKNTIEDKFIHNTLTLQLQTVSKQRDFFKYECLKLNSQHQTLRQDYKNSTAQASNSQEQIHIYHHLLQTAKIKNQELQQTISELKNSFKSIAFQPISPKNCSQKQSSSQKELTKRVREIKEKNEAIRALRERVHELQRVGQLQHDHKMQKKELFELFRVCVDNWKRELMARVGKEDRRGINLAHLTTLNKKQLLRTLFTHPQFLQFLERLLFDEGLKVTFESVQENYIAKNRSNLLEFMKKHRINTAPRVARR